jgi:ribonuclease-3
MAQPDEPRASDELQEALAIRFADEALLHRALTHRSYTAEAPGVESNERLEFLGDAVLDLVIAEELFQRYPTWAEGELTKARATLVGELGLEGIARRWGLGRYVRISHNEEISGGRERRALLADAVEAVFGAYYLDQGLAACRVLILAEMADELGAVEGREFERDFKTRLQENLQARFQSAPAYLVTEVTGPPHSREFTVAVSFGGRVLGCGYGRSKKEAEQRAAADALESPVLEGLQRPDA